MAAVRKLDVLAAEATAGNANTVVELAGVEVEVLPMRQWRSSAVSAMKDGDFDTWAGTCLAPDSLATWLDIDPTLEQVEQFFRAWGEATGQTVGESSASPRSLRSTARRSKRT